MKKIIIFIWCLGGYYHIGLRAQNLVLNPSFEEYTDCENYMGEFEFAAVNWFAQPACEYYNTCTNDYGEMNTSAGWNTVPLNFFGYQTPHSGNAYAAIFTFDNNPNSLSSEYLIANLSSPLQANSLYMVQFWVNRSDFSGYYITKLSACLTDTLVYDSSLLLDASYYTPQISNGGTLLSDTINWIKICGLYKAQGGEKYLVIGNFDAEYHNGVPLPINTQHNYHSPSVEAMAYYYVDDVSVELVPDHNYHLDIGNDTTICDPPPYNIMANAYSSSFIHYIWSTGDTTASIPITQPGNYWVQADLGGCYLFDQISVTHPTAPAIALGLDTTLCAASFPVSLTAPLGYQSYTWSNGSTQHSISITDAGIYSLTAQFACGTTTDTITIQKLHPPNNALSLGDDVINCTDNEILTSITLSSNIALANYEWSNGASTPTITVSTPQNYWLRSSNECGEVVDSIQLLGCSPSNTYVFIVPNAFSPNNDHHNDYISPIADNISLQYFAVYDRWGRQLYHATDPSTVLWDGTDPNTGQSLPMGVYVWVAQYTTPAQPQQLQTSKGNITLLR